MAGTQVGGKRAAEKNKLNYGEDFYAKIGAIGGRKGKTGGFASEKKGPDGLTGRERARIAGAKGGRISRRTKKPLTEYKINESKLRKVNRLLNGY